MKTTRITLSLDEDLAEALRILANVQYKSLEQVVNEALRRGLSSKVGEAPGPAYEVKPADGGVVTGMGEMMPNHLNDVLMNEEFLEKERKIRDRNR